MPRRRSWLNNVKVLTYDFSLTMPVMEHLGGIRTAEAHGAGTLRTSTLGAVPISESKPASLVAHYNIGHCQTKSA